MSMDNLNYLENQPVLMIWGDDFKCKYIEEHTQWPRQLSVMRW